MGVESSIQSTHATKLSDDAFLNMHHTAMVVLKSAMK